MTESHSQAGGGVRLPYAAEPPLAPKSGMEEAERRILFVDDEPAVLDGLRRQLRKDYDIRTARAGDLGLGALESDGPFAVVVSDYKMPEMNGVTFLSRVKDMSPMTVRMLLTGQADMAATIEAVNQANIFRLLTKPCPSDQLRLALDAALEQYRLVTSEATYLRRIEFENMRYDDLLHAVFPTKIVQELKETNVVQPRRHEEVVVMFSDIVGFTEYCDRHEPEIVVRQLQELFEAFEDITVSYGLEKTKTIGDAYMATAGLLFPLSNPVIATVRCALDMITVARSVPPHWDLRVGIHVGAASAGVIGRRQFLFDLWGDTVNTAARVESNGVAGAVTVSKKAWDLISTQCRGESIGMVELKGKGAMELYRVDEVLA